jgi:hypothetical protein
MGPGSSMSSEAKPQPSQENDGLPKPVEDDPLEVLRKVLERLKARSREERIAEAIEKGYCNFSVLKAIYIPLTQN